MSNTINRYYTYLGKKYGGRTHYLVPFTVIGGGEAVVKDILTRKPAWSREEIQHKVDEDVILDPGGMISMKDDNKLSFELATPEGPITFHSYWDKLGLALDYLNNGTEVVIEGETYFRFPQYNYHLYVPIELVEPLKDKMLSLNFSPQADARVTERKNMLREMMEEGHYGVVDSEGNLHTGPGSGEKLK